MAWDPKGARSRWELLTSGARVLGVTLARAAEGEAGRSATAFCRAGLRSSVATVRRLAGGVQMTSHGEGHWGSATAGAGVALWATTKPGRAGTS